MSLTVGILPYGPHGPPEVDLTPGLRYPDPQHATPTCAFTEAAERGTVATSGFDMDDVGGVANLVGLKWLVADESGCVGHERLFTGFLADRQIGRGYSLVTGTDREWNTVVVDANILLSERIIQSGIRPAETDIARISWLIGTGYRIMPSIHDNGLIDSTGPVSMPASDYTGRYPLDVLNDCADLSDKSYYLTWDDSTGYNILAYHANDSTLNESTLRISNVRSDIDQTTTFFPSIADKMRRDPSRVYAGVFFEYSGGHVYRYSALNASNFRYRDVRVTDMSVTTAAAATTLADAYLARVGAEEDRMMSCRLEEVPASKVNLIRAGMRIQCRFSHIPGYESFTWLRVMRRTVSSLGQGIYLLDLELSNPILTGFTGPVTPPSAPVTGPQPLACGNLGSIVEAHAQGTQNVNGWPTVAITPDAGAPTLLFASMVSMNPSVGTNTGMTVPTGYTGLLQQDYSHRTFSISTRHLDLPVGSYTAGATFTVGGPWFDGRDDHWIAQQIAIKTSATTPVHGLSLPGSLYITLGWDPTPGNLLLMYCSAESSGINAPAGWTELCKVTHTYAGILLTQGVWARCVEEGDGRIYDFAQVDGYSGSCSSFMSEWEISGLGLTGAVAPGQHVVDETPTPAPNGATSAFSTAHPYSPGSLVLRIDGMPQIVTESDPTTGAFTIIWTPATGDAVRVDYVATS